MRKRKTAPASGEESRPEPVARRRRKRENQQKPGKLSLAAIEAVASYGLQVLTTELGRECHHVRLAVAGDDRKTILGIPMPLVMEWFIDCSSFPLGFIATVVGKYGCNKSSFKWEVARWFLNYGGVMTDLENESKPSMLSNCILGYPEHFEQKRWNTVPCNSVEEWQTSLQRVYDKQRTFMDPGASGAKGKYHPGRIYPFMVAVDSVMGKLSQGSQENIEDKGYADRATSAYGYEANIITQFLKKIPHDLVEWPHFLLLINHLKEGAAKPGSFVRERRKAGGAGIDFAEALEIELVRAGSGKVINKISRGGFEIGSNKIKMKAWKNSLGQDRREVMVELVWWHELVDTENGPETRFCMRWDWYSALIDLFFGFSADRKAMINEVCHIVKQAGDKYHCKQLGIGANASVSKQEMGEAVSKDSKVREGLRRVLGIKPIKLFKLGECYKAQMDEQLIAYQREMSVPLQRHPLELAREAEQRSGS